MPLWEECKKVKHNKWGEWVFVAAAIVVDAGGIAQREKWEGVKPK